MSSSGASLGRVLVTARSFKDLPGPHHAILTDAGCEVVRTGVNRALSETELIEAIGDIDALIAGNDKVTVKVLAAGSRLKIVARHGVGYDNVDVPAATRAGVAVTVATGANRVAVAELAMALMLSLTQSIPTLSASTKAGSWGRVVACELHGKVLGIVGLGRIGKEVALRARAFGMSVLAYDVVRDDAFAAANRVTYTALPDLLSASNFVTLHCFASPGAPPVIGRTELAQMKKGAYLVNAARGSLVDEAALVEAFAAGRLGGAGLDTFAEEPPVGSPLLKMDNVVATPHIGGFTTESVIATAVAAAESVVQALRGEQPAGVVNPEYSKA